MSEIDLTATLKMYKILGEMEVNIFTSTSCLERLLENGVMVKKIEDSGDISEVDDSVKLKLCQVLPTVMESFYRVELLLAKMDRAGVIFVPAPVTPKIPEVSVPGKFEKLSYEDFSVFWASNEMWNIQSPNIFEDLSKHDIFLCRFVRPVNPPLVIIDFVMKGSETMLVSGMPDDCVQWIKANSEQCSEDRAWVALGGPQGGALPAEYYVLLEDRIVR